MKSLLKKLKQKKRNKTKQLEIKLVEVKNASNPIKVQSELKELNKIHIVDKNLHEIKNKIFGVYAGEFEMFGKMSVGDQIRETHIRFRSNTEYESYINAIDQDSESEDAFFNG